ncbi:MAG TPA: guanylate kinase [bacterium]|nr:guanylate kinase [bacterium]
MKTQPGLLFVVAAPSGAGKTSLCKALLERMRKDGERELHWSVSYTTRQRRRGERHGRDYFFVDDAAFDRMIAADEFAEWAHVHGRRYGTSKAYLEKSAAAGRDLLVEIDTQGARQLKRKYKNACFIFVLPPSWPVLERRLTGRGTEGAEEIKLRLKRAHQEILEWRRFNYIILNDDFNKAVDRLAAVVAAKRLEQAAMEPVATKVMRGSKHPG